MDGGGRLFFIRIQTDRQKLLGEGIERRKENSARKKLKTKRKEPKEKFCETRGTRGALWLKAFLYFKRLRLTVRPTQTHHRFVYSEI